MEYANTRKTPFVCNGCDKQKKCRFNKYFYYAKEANEDYRFKLVVSKLDIYLECDEF